MSSQDRRAVVFAVTLIAVASVVAALSVWPSRPNGPVADCGFDSVCTARNPSGFALTLSVNTTSVKPNGSLTSAISVLSLTSRYINMSTSDKWFIPSLPASCICECGTWAFEVFKGYYTLSDVSSARDIIYTDVYPSCLSVTPPTAYSIPPASTLPTLISTLQFQYYYSYQIYAVNGGGVKSGITNVGVDSLRSDKPAVYTMVVGDEWGDFVTINFSVAA